MIFMPRKIIPLVTGETYHIINRGVDKRVVFVDDEDYLRFYSYLQYFNKTQPSVSLFESVRRSEPVKENEMLVKIHAYCFPVNHFHLLLTQNIDGGISEFMKRLGGGYTSYFNEKYERSGSLFQGTYKKFSVSNNAKLLHLSAYINYNFVVHDTRDSDTLFKSSREVYTGKKRSPFIFSDLILSQYKNTTEYSENALMTVTQLREQRAKERLQEFSDLYGE